MNDFHLNTGKAGWEIFQEEMKKLWERPMRKIIVAGSRDFIYREFLFSELDKLIKEPCIILCGEAKGADTYGKQWALSRNHDVASFPANWDKHGKAAGMIRNQEMIDDADELIAFWDGVSRGTADVVRRAEKKGIPITIINYTL